MKVAMNVVMNIVMKVAIKVVMDVVMNVVINIVMKVAIKVVMKVAMNVPFYQKRPLNKKQTTRTSVYSLLFNYSLVISPRFVNSTFLIIRFNDPVLLRLNYLI